MVKTTIYLTQVAATRKNFNIVLHLIRNPIFYISRHILTRLLFRSGQGLILKPIFISLLTITYTLVKTVGWFSTMFILWRVRSVFNQPYVLFMNSLNTFGSAGLLLKKLLQINGINADTWKILINNPKALSVFNWLIFINCFGSFSSIFRWFSKTFFVILLTSAGVMFIR